MAVGEQNQGYVALVRFGYGPRGDGDLAAAESDPRNFLKAELAQPGIALLSGPALPASSVALQALFADQAAKKAERERQEKEGQEAKERQEDKEKTAALGPAAKTSGDMMMESPSANTQSMMPPASGEAMRDPPKPPPAPSPESTIFKAEATARLRRAIEARAGLAERLVAFWSNHFCVGANKSQLARISVGAFEREAIRPHVLGSFKDMLLAVAKHPAMLHYLDNAQSIGPNSKAGGKSGRGLNENFAREMMELHTLGVGGGYTQDDVTTLAKVLTGWTSVGAGAKLGEPGTFVFNANAHEPGPQTLLGKTYAEDGMAQGEAVLNDLAQHPATGHFIATKFTRHFIADAPSDRIVHHLADVFRKTDGDLKALTFALIDADEAWSAKLQKMRSPYDFLVAAYRATSVPLLDAGQILGPLTLMGMPLWTPPGPNGFADDAGSWASPEGLKLRLDYAAQYTGKLKDPPNPSDLFDALCGSYGSSETRQALGRAESRQQGLALLLMSPEFQWR